MCPLQVLLRTADVWAEVDLFGSWSDFRDVGLSTCSTLDRTFNIKQKEREPPIINLELLTHSPTYQNLSQWEKSELKIKCTWLPGKQSNASAEQRTWWMQRPREVPSLVTRSLWTHWTAHGREGLRTLGKQALHPYRPGLWAQAAL